MLCEVIMRCSEQKIWPPSWFVHIFQTLFANVSNYNVGKKKEDNMHDIDLHGFIILCLKAILSSDNSN